MNQKDRWSLYSLCIDIVSLKDVQSLPLIAEVMIEGPQLEGLQILVSGSFKDGDVDVKVGDLLVDRALVLLETSRLELCLCIVASVC